MGGLDLMASLFEVEALDAKEVLFAEGDEGDKLYIVCEGDVTRCMTHWEKFLARMCALH